MNRRLQNAYNNYLRSTDRDIFDAYARPSEAKVRAWERCKATCEWRNGYGLKVITHNCQMFTAGFEFIDDDGVINFMFITPSHVDVAEI